MLMLETWLSNFVSLLYIADLILFILTHVITCIFVNEADIVVDKNEVHCSVTTATNLHILKCKKKTLHFRN
jgi:uncharacterized membrane protein (DUF485 family)